MGESAGAAWAACESGVCDSKNVTQNDTLRKMMVWMKADATARATIACGAAPSVVRGVTVTVTNFTEYEYAPDRAPCLLADAVRSGASCARTCHAPRGSNR